MAPDSQLLTKPDFILGNGNDYDFLPLGTEVGFQLIQGWRFRQRKDITTKFVAHCFLRSCSIAIKLRIATVNSATTPAHSSTANSSDLVSLVAIFGGVGAGSSGWLLTTLGGATGAPPLEQLRQCTVVAPLSKSTDLLLGLLLQVTASPHLLHVVSPEEIFQPQDSISERDVNSRKPVTWLLLRLDQGQDIGLLDQGAAAVLGVVAPKPPLA
jgi:hypothetical protein